MRGSLLHSYLTSMRGLSVVDHREVTDDEIVFLASEFAGDALTEFGVRVSLA